MHPYMITFFFAGLLTAVRYLCVQVRGGTHLFFSLSFIPFHSVGVGRLSWTDVKPASVASSIPFFLWRRRRRRPAPLVFLHKWCSCVTWTGERERERVLLCWVLRLRVLYANAHVTYLPGILSCCCCCCCSREETKCAASTLSQGFFRIPQLKEDGRTVGRRRSTTCFVQDHAAQVEIIRHR